MAEATTAGTDEGTRRRRFLQPRLVVPAGLAALVLVGGSVWAVSGGGGGSTAPVGAGAATPSVTATAEPSASAQPSPSPSAVPSPGLSVAPEPDPAPATAEPEQLGGGAPTATRKPTGKAAEATPAAKPQGTSAGKPKAPSGRDPQVPPPCPECEAKAGDPDPQHTCIHDAAGRFLTCSPVQIGTPLPRPGQPAATPTPGGPDHTH
ncbi:hypothetical protein ACFU7Y_08790 [Kitasatospora sp. NPDC057542]|uniref:hypothetical protein n=1 Tax=Kitasatospora sp. NPDC057542 TaxID=3346162 RepID=UPI0036A4195E